MDDKGVTFCPMSAGANGLREPADQRGRRSRSPRAVPFRSTDPERACGPLRSTVHGAAALPVRAAPAGGWSCLRALSVPPISRIGFVLVEAQECSAPPRPAKRIDTNKGRRPEDYAAPSRAASKAPPCDLASAQPSKPFSKIQPGGAIEQVQVYRHSAHSSALGRRAMDSDMVRITKTLRQQQWYCKNLSQVL